MMLKRLSFDASVRATDTMVVVANKLAAHQGAVVVLSDEGKLIGIITERDLVSAYSGQSDTFSQLQAADIMSTDLTTCGPDTTELQAITAMVDKGVRHLPVMLGDTVVGILSINEAVKQRLQKISTVRERLEGEPGDQERLSLLNQHLKDDRGIFEIFRTVSSVQERMGLQSLTLEARQILWVIGDRERLRQPLLITDLLKGHKYGSFPTVRRYIRELENDGLVMIVADNNDSRRKNIVLSDRGRSVFKEISDTLSELFARPARPAA